MDDLPLFAPSDPGGGTTWSVARLNEAISIALQDRFPGEIWVKGEIQGLSRTRMRKHWYFELVEKKPLGEGVKARLSVALLSWKRAEVDRTIASTPGFVLDDGIEVRIRGRVDFYPPFGKLQFAMTGIDPSFTLGQLAAQRERVLRALEAEGLLRRNARLPLPTVPARIGLVTSVGSAAYNDFLNELEQGGFGHHLEVVDARVQGADAESTLLAALRTLSRRELDVVAIVRGGGSRSDLAAFDSEALARAIAGMDLPVITGIGHEIDTSVADMVAHTAYKTPTACAAALVQQTARFMEDVESAWERIARRARSRIEEEERSLVAIAHQTAVRARVHLAAAGQAISTARRRLFREAPRIVEHRRRVLLSLGGELRAVARLSILRRRQRLQIASRSLSMARLAPQLERRAERLARHHRRIVKEAVKVVTREGAHLDDLSTRIRLLDPMRVLHRGYSISRDERGRLVRSVADIIPGSLLSTTLTDGIVLSRVEEARVRTAAEEEQESSAGRSFPRREEGT